MKKLTLALTIVVLFGACNTDENDIQIQADEVIDHESLYLQASDEMSDLISSFAISLQTSDASEDFLSFSEEHFLEKYGANSEFMVGMNSSYYFNRAYKNARSENDPVFVSQYEVDLLNTVNDSWLQATSVEELQNRLNWMLTITISSDLASEYKNVGVTYLTGYLIGLDLLSGSIEETAADGRIEGWWQSWGKCAAGTLGGVLGGGLGGAAAGSAIPVLGTAAGGIIGGIAGGLTGAAASCDSAFAFGVPVTAIDSDYSFYGNPNAMLSGELVRIDNRSHYISIY